MTHSDLQLQLSNRYDVVACFSMSNFYKLPSATLYNDLRLLYRSEFAPQQRIVFTCFDSLSDQQVKIFLTKLQKCLTFVDISNFFILIVGNRTWIKDYVDEIKLLHAPGESTSFGYEHYNIDSDLSTIEATALLDTPDTICGFPWISLDITATGEFKPCCFFNKHITDSTGQKFNASRDTLNEVYQSDFMKDLRQQFREGKKPEECRRCWNEERDNVPSKRLLLKHRFPEFSYDANWEQDDISNLKMLSIAFGNICNLKCRICHASNSSQIAIEEISMIPKDNQKKSSSYQHLVNGRWIRDDHNVLWDQLIDPDLNLAYFDFAGGEPLLSDQHFEVLRHFIHQRSADQIELHYNTNGTIFPKKYADLWKHFKKVDIAVSIDNIGTRAELERSGCDWQEIENNLQEFFKLKSSAIQISLHLAISLQNVLYLPEICDWIELQQFDSVHFSNLYYPAELNLQNLTPMAKELVFKKLSAYHNNNPILTKFIKETVDIVKAVKPSNGESFCNFIKNLDLRRSENFAITHSEIAQAMGYV